MPKDETRRNSKAETRRNSKVETNKKVKKKKKKVKVNVGLSKQDVEYLNKNTRFDEQEIKNWYRLVLWHLGTTTPLNWDLSGCDFC